MYSSIPDYYILDTKEAVLEYKQVVSAIEGAEVVVDAMPIGALIMDTVTDDKDYEYQISLLLYDIISEFVFSDRAGSEVVVNALRKLADTIRSELKRSGCVDERGFCHYTFYSWTADHCMVLQHFTLDQND
jgi:hypothetical protein